MKRLWNILAHPAIAFWLLLFCAVLLSFGAVIARVDATGVKQLNDMLFHHWLPLHIGRPVLYGWIFAVMLALTVLALNTVACMANYIIQTQRIGLWRRRAGIIIFHGCFLIFLFGHLLSTFWGSVDTLTLKEGQTTAVPGAAVRLTAADISHAYEAGLDGPLLARITAGLAVQDDAGRVSNVELAGFAPKFSNGYSFHVALKETGLAPDEVQIVMRRDYGLPVLVCGACFTLLALGLYGLSLKRR